MILKTCSPDPTEERTLKFLQRYFKFKVAPLTWIKFK